MHTKLAEAKPSHIWYTSHTQSHTFHPSIHTYIHIYVRTYIQVCKQVCKHTQYIHLLIYRGIHNTHHCHYMYHIQTYIFKHSTHTFINSYTPNRRTYPTYVHTTHTHIYTQPYPHTHQPLTYTLQTYICTNTHRKNNILVYYHHLATYILWHKKSRTHSGTSTFTHTNIQVLLRGYANTGKQPHSRAHTHAHTHTHTHIMFTHSYTHTHHPYTPTIDSFTNMLSMLYILNKGCSWQPESLPEVCPTKKNKYCMQSGIRVL